MKQELTSRHVLLWVVLASITGLLAIAAYRPSIAAGRALEVYCAVVTTLCAIVVMVDGKNLHDDGVQ